MSLDVDQLYALLPAIYRTRDSEKGQPLYALFTVLAEQSGIVEDNIKQLYDDQFIETCAPWAIPYLGDLIGSNTIYELEQGATGRRAEVANTIGCRRRKGTVLALEQMAMDVSGLPAAAVEFFKRLITTESMHHLRPRHEATLNLRNGARLERIDTAFDTVNRTIDVRRIAPRLRAIADPDPVPLDINLHGGGRFNIPDVGMVLWRWKAFPIIRAAATKVDARRCIISLLGSDAPLFNALAPRTSFERLTGRLDVSQPILRREFNDNLTGFYGEDQGIAIYADDVLIDAKQICCRDLSNRLDGSWGFTCAGKVAIDPVLGRIQFADDLPVPTVLQASYSYGFPAKIGGGPYDRTQNLPPLDPSGFAFIKRVGDPDALTLEAAVALWNAQPDGTGGLIVVPGVQALEVDLTGPAAIMLPAESVLWIVSAQLNPAGPNDFTYDNSLAVLRGSIQVDAQRGSGDGVTIPPSGQLSISGIWLSGDLHLAGDAAQVQLLDCTLVPGIALDRAGHPMHPGQPSILATVGELDLSLTRTITGALAVAPGGLTRICSSIVDSGSHCGVAYAADDLAAEGAGLHIEDSTVIGKVRTGLMELASNTIFLARLARLDPWKAALWCTRQQSGCIRFCFLPATAIVPRQFQCLPPTSAQEALFQPQFVSLRYGNPAYGLLSGDTPMAIWTGADNGSQIGVYNLLQETEAVRNVQLRTQEYLPFGLEAGVFLEPSKTATASSAPAPHPYDLSRKPDPCGDSEDDDLRFAGVGAALI